MKRFILLASPESAATKWVAKETQYWLDHREPDRLLVAVTDGELVWNPYSRATRGNIDVTLSVGGMAIARQAA